MPRGGGLPVVALKSLVLQVVVVPEIAGSGKASVVDRQFPVFLVVYLAQAGQKCGVDRGASGQVAPVGFIVYGSVKYLPPVEQGSACKNRFRAILSESLPVFLN